MRRKRRIGINALSLFPWSIGPGCVERTIEMAKDAGCDGIQLLPLRDGEISLVMKT